MIGPVLIAVVMLLGLALMGAGAYLEARSRPRGGQVVLRNAPRPRVQSTIPTAPPRGQRVTRSPDSE